MRKKVRITRRVCAVFVVFISMIISVIGPLLQTDAVLAEETGRKTIKVGFLSSLVITTLMSMGIKVDTDMTLYR